MEDDDDGSLLVSKRQQPGATASGSTVAPAIHATATGATAAVGGAGAAGSATPHSPSVLASSGAIAAVVEEPPALLLDLMDEQVHKTATAAEAAPVRKGAQQQPQQVCFIAQPQGVLALKQPQQLCIQRLNRIN